MNRQATGNYLYPLATVVGEHDTPLAHESSLACFDAKQAALALSFRAPTTAFKWMPRHIPPVPAAVSKADTQEERQRHPSQTQNLVL